MDKYFTVAYTALYKQPSYGSIKYLDIPTGSIVVPLSEYDMDDEKLLWIEVNFQTNDKVYTGWIPQDYAEPFVQLDYDIIKIDHPTASQSDAAQYFIYMNGVQFNLCGEFASLYCAGWYDFSIEEWLGTWKLKSPSVFNRIFSGGKSKVTGIPDLANMLHTFDGYPDVFESVSARFAFRGRTLFTPLRLKNALKNNRIIIGCKIEGQFGELRPSGIGHWIVLEGCSIEARTAMIYYYNPFTNAIDRCGWKTLADSVGSSPFGILVPRGDNVAVSN